MKAVRFIMILAALSTFFVLGGGRCDDGDDPIWFVPTPLPPLTGVEAGRTCAVTEVISYYYVGGNWVEESRIRAAYDPSGRQTEMAFDFFDVFWQNMQTTGYTYDGNGTLIESTSTMTMFGMFFTGRSFYTYGMVDQLVQLSGQTLEGLVWEDSFSTDYIYDGSDRLVEEIESSYNPYTLTWDNNYMTGYSYDGSGRCIRESEYMFSFGNTWDETYRTDYTYDGLGMLSEETRSMYNMLCSAWINWGKYEYVCDNNGRFAQETYYTWSGSDWVQLGQGIYSYDGDGRLQEQIYYDWTGADWALSGKSVTIWVDMPDGVFIIDDIAPMPMRWMQFLWWGEEINQYYVP